MILFWTLMLSLLILALLFIILPLTKQSKTRRDKVVLITVCILIVLFSVGLYFKQGSAPALSQRIAMERRAIHLQALLDTIGHDPYKAIAMMKTYLKNKPKDRHAWYLLGKLYENVGDSKQAQAAFKRNK